MTNKRVLFVVITILIFIIIGLNIKYQSAFYYSMQFVQYCNGIELPVEKAYVWLVDKDKNRIILTTNEHGYVQFNNLEYKEYIMLIYYPAKYEMHTFGATTVKPVNKVNIVRTIDCLKYDLGE